MPVIQADRLREIATALLVANKVPENEAQTDDMHELFTTKSATWMRANKILCFKSPCV